MTLYIPSDATSGNISFNVSNCSGLHQLKLTSLYGKEIFTWDLTIVETNDRYTEFSLSFTEQQRSAHLNGVYEYTILKAGAYVQHGLLKLVIENGGSPDTVEYISNNEDRQAPVYYRPEY